MSSKRNNNLTCSTLVLVLTLSLNIFGCSTTNMSSDVLKPNLIEWEIECKKGLLVNLESIEIALPYRQRRCELVKHDWLKIGQPFRLSFSIEPIKLNIDDSEWHIIGQIHSFPDSGEDWRCPVLSIEVKNGNLRMYNRWDSNHISRTINDTCAQKGNSIKSRLVFKDYRLEQHKQYNVAIDGLLSYQKEGWLKVSINNEVVGSVWGYTAFNDKRGPYLKLGIYKPTQWTTTQQLHYRYTKISFQTR